MSAEARAGQVCARRSILSVGNDADHGIGDRGRTGRVGPLFQHGHLVEGAAWTKLRDDLLAPLG